jgi:hypothetical protein
MVEFQKNTLGLMINLTYAILLPPVVDTERPIA